MDAKVIAIFKVVVVPNQFSRFFKKFKYLSICSVFFSQLSTLPESRMSTCETATSSTENSEKFSNSNSSSSADVPKDATPSEGSRTESSSRDNKREASWPSVLFYIHLNILGVYGIFVLFSHTSAITFLFSKYCLLPKQYTSYLTKIMF